MTSDFGEYEVVGHDDLLHSVAPYAFQLSAVLTRDRVNGPWIIFRQSMTRHQAREVVALLNLVGVGLGLSHTLPIRLRDDAPVDVPRHPTVAGCREAFREFIHSELRFDEDDFDTIYLPTDAGQHAINPQALRSGYMSSGHWRLASLLVTYVNPIDGPALDVLTELAQKDGASVHGISGSSESRV